MPPRREQSKSWIAQPSLSIISRDARTPKLPGGLACAVSGLNMLATSRGASAKDAMLGNLFRTLTAEPSRGAKLFAAATAEARKPHWYIEGAVPDTIDGCFAVLATVLALVIVR